MTRKVLIVCLAIFVLAGGTASWAQSVQKSPGGALEPVTWLIGGTWVSDVKDPDDGRVTHVENHITWAPNHQAIQFVTDFNGKPHYNGFYAYDPAKQTINFFYTSENGQLTIGTATPDADGKTTHQEFDIMSPGGKTGHVRSTLVRDGDNAYWFTVFLQKNGEWSPEFKIRYERK